MRLATDSEKRYYLGIQSQKVRFLFLKTALAGAVFTYLGSLKDF